MAGVVGGGGSLKATRKQTLALRLLSRPFIAFIPSLIATLASHPPHAPPHILPPNSPPHSSSHASTHSPPALCSPAPSLHSSRTTLTAPARSTRLLSPGENPWIFVPCPVPTRLASPASCSTADNQTTTNAFICVRMQNSAA